jgi:hypothetical protein
MFGREVPLPWSPFSPDMTLLDFFMCGYVKSIVYQSPVTGIDDLKKCIADTGMLLRT